MKFLLFYIYRKVEIYYNSCSGWKTFRNTLIYGYICWMK